MSFIGASAMGVATGPASGLRFAQTRGRTNGSPVTGVNYPSPFFDIAHTYLPVTFKQMFKWCRYYFLTNPLINAVVFKLSEYPVTDIIIDHENSAVKKQWTEYFHDHLRFNAFRVEAGLDFNCYGNSFVSLGFPFKKYLYCAQCGFHDQAGKIRANWIFTNFQFRMTCPQCHYIGDARAQDVFYKNASGIKTIRWNPEDIEVTYNDITGEHTYFYTIPATVRNDIVIGRKDVVEGVPQVFIQAMREQKGVIFSKDNFFHMRRPTLATQDRGWGIPLLLPVLKDAFYLQVMKKAQEAILVEHIVPLRVLFPQAGSGSSDPYTTINLVDWRDQIAAEIARWRYDCVTPGTLVETSDGFCAAAAVREGYLLKNHLGAYSKVEKIWRRPLREGERAYQVVARGLHGGTPTVSEGHPFLVRRNEVQRFLRAKDLRVGDYVGYPFTETMPLELRALATSGSSIVRDGFLWSPIEAICEVRTEEVIGFQMDHATVVHLEDDAEAHGTFCLWGMASANTNYIPILPLPIGHQTIGGDGRALLLTQEIITWSEQILNGMGVPLEFIKGGMCLSPSSLIFTDRGLERLDEVAQPGSTRRLTVTHDGLHAISQVHSPGVKRGVRVTTRSGLVLEGAMEHGALTLKEDLAQEFIPLGVLQPGNFVGVRVGANLWPTKDAPLTTTCTKTGKRFRRADLPTVRLPETMSWPLAKLLGYLISEGTCTKETELEFSSIDRELAEDFVACTEAVFGYTPSIGETPYETVRAAEGRTRHTVRIAPQVAVEFLQQLGATGNSYDKTVPRCVRLSTQETVAAFLQAYFDGDGGYSTSSDRACASAHSVSHRLLQEVQLLLLNMGIVSSLYEPVEMKSTYTLQIRSVYAAMFAEKVGFFCKRKISKTEEAINQRRPGNLSLTVPYLNDVLRALKKRTTTGACSWKLEPVTCTLSQEEYTTAELGRAIGRDFSSVCNYIKKGVLRATWKDGVNGRFGSYVIARDDAQAFLRDCGLGRRYALKTRQYEYGYDRLAATDLSAVRALDPALFSRIETLKAQEFFWDEVISVEELTVEEEMLDLGVEDIHSYQANGILCHNSYAGTNVSMRMMENMFLGIILRHRQLARFIMKQVAYFLGWPEATLRFKPFKMADDLQRKAFLFQLNQASKCSDTTLLADSDLSQEEENGIMVRETDLRTEAAKKQQLAMANIQGEAQLVMMKFQAKAQQVLQAAQGSAAAPGEPGAADGAQGAVGAAPPAGPAPVQNPVAAGGGGGPPPIGGAPPAEFLSQLGSQLSVSQRMDNDNGMSVDLQSLAAMQARTVAMLPDNMQEVALQNLALQSPELADLTRQILSQLPGKEEKTTNNAVDQRPLPDQRPPRRAAGGV